MSRTQQIHKPGSGALSRGTSLYLAAGVVVILVYFLLPEIPQDVLYVLVAFSAVAGNPGRGQSAACGP